MKRMVFEGKEDGSAMEFVSFGLVLLGFATIMMVYLGCVELIEYKLKTGQVARKYILRMESVGYLNGNDQSNLLEELDEVGLVHVDLSGSTINPVGYGEEILLSIKGQVIGRLMGRWEKLFEIKEIRASTAKY